MKIARVMLSTECNLPCSYCCNNLKHIQESFKMTTMDNLIDMNYDVINITGGEPMMVLGKLIRLIRRLKAKHKAPSIYLYTNGYSFLEAFQVPSIDGVSIGIHNFEDIQSCLYAIDYWKEKAENVRVMVEDRHAHKIKHRAEVYGATVIEWTMNKCDNTPEDRWII